MVQMLRQLSKGDSVKASMDMARFFTDIARGPVPPGIDTSLTMSYYIKVRDIVSREEFGVYQEKLMAELSAQNNPHEVLAAFKQRWQAHPTKQGTWLALEEIRDPGNLGTIIRTVDAVGAAGVILVGASVDPYARESVRASMGSIFSVPLVRTNVLVTDLVFRLPFAR